MVHNIGRQSFSPCMSVTPTKNGMTSFDSPTSASTDTDGSSANSAESANHDTNARKV